MRKTTMINGFINRSIVVGISILFIISCIPITQGFVDGNILNNLKVRINSKDDSLFDIKIRLLMILGHMPSLSVSIIKNNTIKWAKGYGYADRQHKIHSSNNTVYWIASVSKTFAATAILQLHEQNQLDLDEDISKYLDFKLRNPKYPNLIITCRMLLAHRSSLSRFVIPLGIYFTLLGYPVEWLKEFLIPSGSFYKKNIWSNYSPGEKFIYSDLGFEILGYIVERITNQSFDKYCKEHILQPLNMNNTSYHLKDFELKKIARFYIWIGGIYIPLPHFQINNYAAAGLRTNVLDLSRFLLVHMNNGTYNGVTILNENSTEMMHSLQLGNEFYGLGWYIINLNEEIYEGHQGIAIGSRAEMWYRPSDKTGIIYFWNQCEMFPFRYRLIEHFAQNEIGRLLWDKADNL